MEFIETSFFPRRITELLSHDEYVALQVKLIKNPCAGKLIPTGGGLRKLRWKASGRGKRGGIRIIYYCLSENKLVMFYAYDKAEQKNLMPEQLKFLRDKVKGGAL